MRCSELLVELEIRQGHLEAAEELLRELPGASSGLWQRVAALHLERQRRATEDARLRAVAYEVDPMVASRTRTAFLVSLAFVYFAVAVAFVATRMLVRMSPTGMF